MHSPDSGSCFLIGSLAQVWSSAHSELSKSNFNYRSVISFMSKNLYQKPGGAARDQPIVMFHNYSFPTLAAKGMVAHRNHIHAHGSTHTQHHYAGTEYGLVVVALTLLRCSAVYLGHRVSPLHTQGHKCSPVKRLKCAVSTLARIHALQPQSWATEPHLTGQAKAKVWVCHGELQIEKEHNSLLHSS